MQPPSRTTRIVAALLFVAAVGGASWWWNDHRPIDDHVPTGFSRSGVNDGTFFIRFERSNGCDEAGPVSVAESDNAVRILLTAVDTTGMACTGVYPGPLMIPIGLERPLGDRVVIDCADDDHRDDRACPPVPDPRGPRVQHH